MFAGILPKAINTFVQITNTGTMQGGNGVDRRILNKTQAALELLLDRLTVVRTHPVPFIDHDDNRASQLYSDPHQM